jgi:hypothetical protein
MLMLVKFCLKTQGWFSPESDGILDTASADIGFSKQTLNSEVEG